MPDLTGPTWFVGCRRRYAVLAVTLSALALIAAGCGGVAKPHPATRIDHLAGVTLHGRYCVTCTPPDGSIRLGRPQVWTVVVTTRVGRPTDDLRVRLGIFLS